MRKVLIVGRGLLGTFLAKHLPHERYTLFT